MVVTYATSGTVVNVRICLPLQQLTYTFVVTVCNVFFLFVFLHHSEFFVVATVFDVFLNITFRFFFIDVIVCNVFSINEVFKKIAV